MFPILFLSHFSGLILGSLIWIPATLVGEGPTAFTLSLQWNSDFILISLTCKVGIIFTHWTNLKTVIFLFAPVFHNWHSQVVLLKWGWYNGSYYWELGLTRTATDEKRQNQIKTKSISRIKIILFQCKVLRWLPVSHRKQDENVKVIKSLSRAPPPTKVVSLMTGGSNLIKTFFPNLFLEDTQS